MELVSPSRQSIKSIKTTDISTTSVDVAGLQSGMYILRIKADKQLSFESVIKL